MIIAGFVGGIFGGILVGLAITVLLYPYFSNIDIPKSIDELTKEVKELQKKIAEMIEDERKS